MPTHAIDAILEIFTWVGLGMGVLVGVLTVIVRVADGTWVPAQIVIGEDEHGRIARWFGDDGQVGQARLSHEQEHALAGSETAHAFVRRGRSDRVRLSPGSPAVRGLSWLTIGFLALGALAALGSLIMLFVR
ncbi:hypothetical protein LG299_05615 [Microbacterium lacus]|uniref:hypothetical protein n=1 Tax=Microbacterium lacus TaxID=415217 RepID=UPI00384D04F4